MHILRVFNIPALLLESDNLQGKNVSFFLPRHTIMEALVVVGLVNNIIRIIDFSGKLLSSSKEIYRSSSGVLAAYANVETQTTHLVLLNNKTKDCKSATVLAAKLPCMIDTSDERS